MDSITDNILSNLKKEILKEITKEKASRFTRIVKNETSAKNYAKAMFDAAQELGKIETIKNDFNTVYASMLIDKDVVSFFTSAFVDGNIKIGILKKVYEDSIAEETFNLLSILIERDLINILVAIIVEYENLCNEYYNILSTKIIASSEIENIEELKSSIRNMAVDKNVHFTVEIDESIMGGIIVQIDDVIYDYSVRRLLENVKDSLFAENN